MVVLASDQRDFSIDLCRDPNVSPSSFPWECSAESLVMLVSLELRNEGFSSFMSTETNSFALNAFIVTIPTEDGQLTKIETKVAGNNLLCLSVADWLVPPEVL